MMETQIETSLSLSLAVCVCVCVCVCVFVLVLKAPNNAASNYTTVMLMYISDTDFEDNKS